MANKPACLLAHYLALAAGIKVGVRRAAGAQFWANAFRMIEKIESKSGRGRSARPRPLESVPDALLEVARLCDKRSRKHIRVDATRRIALVVY